ncbi:MAG: hypothetical protein V8T01_11655 [Oscillospiraceae bacterium]
MTETMEKAVALANEESPSKVLASIPRDKLISIPNEICSLLTGTTFRSNKQRCCSK